MATATNTLASAIDRKIPYGPGVLAAVEWSKEPHVQLSEPEKSCIKELCTKATKRDYPARLIEVIQAWEAALFYRGFQFLIPRRGGGWVIPGESTGYGPSMQMDLALLPTNIYSAHAQIIISSLTRSVPNVRFQAQNPTNDAQITAADSSDKFLKVVIRNNDMIMVQTDASRYLWNDGRFLYWTRFVLDGQKFGWKEDDERDDIVPEDAAEAEAPAQTAAESGTASPEEGQSPEQNPENADVVEEEAAESEEEEPTEEGEEEEEFPQRTPNGQEVVTAHGKLEVKLVPMMANDIEDVDVLQYETEVDISRAKGMFPEKADDIRAGAASASEGEIARLARQNVKLGMQSTYITSDSTSQDTTIQRTWFRQSYLMQIDNREVRDSLIKKFPDGMKVVYAGETFIYAQNESIDDCWALGQAYAGDGQNRNALGTSYIPAQKRLNNWLDLMNDVFVRTIPKKWMDNKVFNVEALRGQTNVPGDIGTFKRVDGVPFTELCWVEPAVQVNQSLPDFVKEYSGPLAELLTGAYPALAGGQTDIDTFRGMALQRDQALGRLGQTWHSIKNATATSARQAVRWGAKCRGESINEKIPGGEVIRLEVNDLRANIMCYPESDENFPESYPQKQQRATALFQDSAKNPMLQEVLQNPANLQFMKSMIALPEIVIPQVTSFEKQLGEIEILLKNKPVPNPTIVEAQQKIGQLKEQDVDQAHLDQAMQEVLQLEQTVPLVSSIQVDPEVEDSASEATACWLYLNGPEGRKAKKGNPSGYENVRLHYLAHVEAAAQKAAQNAPPPQQKPPSKSLNYKDVAANDPAAAAQLLQEGGLTPSPPSTMPQATAGAPLPQAPIVQ